MSAGSRRRNIMVGHLGRQAGGETLREGISREQSIAVDLVIDYTASMTDVLGPAYLLCSDFLYMLDKYYEQVHIGLNLIGDQVDTVTWHHEHFTSSVIDVLEKMLSATVGGGRRDGRELIGSALKSAMVGLSEYPARERVLLMITDARAAAADMKAVREACRKPVRAALLFIPTDRSGMEYRFSLVDADGREDLTRTPFMFDIRDVAAGRLFKEGTDPEQEDSEALVRQMLMMIR